jgi:cytochrome oxidase assembly protein ShyY1
MTGNLPSSTTAGSHPLLAVMLRARSIGLLLLCIAIAVVFALFGQWQLSRAVTNGGFVERPTETVLPIERVAQPQAVTTSDAVGQLVSVDGTWVAGDFTVLRDRIDEGRAGYWTIGHFRTAAGDSLPVGVGWTDDLAVAADAAEAWNADPASLPAELTGRYQQGEAPTEPEDGQTLPAEMAPAAFVNLWQDPGPTYAGYITLRTAPGDLQTIASPPPEVEVQLNFLNLFYAVEWVLFALAALYIWYRWMRDIYERELDDAAVAPADGEALEAPTRSAPRP